MKGHISILNHSLILIICIFFAFSHLALSASPEGEDGAEQTQNVEAQEKNEEDGKDATTKEDGAEASLENPSSESGASPIENKEEKNIENIPPISLKKDIENEKAIEGSDPLFPSKKEIEKKPSLLASMEVLRELEDAGILFLKTLPLISKTEELRTPTNEESTDKKETINEDLVANTAPPQKEEMQYENQEDVEEYDSSEEDDFIIDDFDREVATQIEESHKENEADFLTFDEEFEKEKTEKKDSHIEKTPPKYEEVEGKGQLSSVIDEDDKVNISRYTNILKGQAIDFSYPGEGWVYLGEESSKKGMEYQKRKMNGGKTFFTFKANEEGNYILNFSYFDVFSGDFIVDAVSVKVIENKEGIKKDALVLEYQKKDEENAPSIKKTPEEVSIDGEKVGIKIEDATKKEAKIETASSSQAKNVKEELPKKDEKKATSNVEKKTQQAKIQKEKTQQAKDATPTPYKEPEVFVNIASLTPENAKAKEDPEMAANTLQEAQESISQGDAKTALEKIENFFTISSSNIDLAYLLRGKAYELNGSERNVKLALISYQFLVKTFPNSTHADDARRRIRYIEKYFVNIK